MTPPERVALDLTIHLRAGGTSRRAVTVDEPVMFGRSGSGLSGVVEVGESASVSRAAFSIGVEPTGMCRVSCRQRSGTVEVRRPDGLVAAALRRSEVGLFHPPLTAILHTPQGVFVSVQVVGANTARAVAPGAAGSGDGALTTTRTGWGTVVVLHPPPGMDWFVAAGVAAMLLHRGRVRDRGYVVQRGVLLRSCGRWLGTPKSEGWLASKFRQASESLGVPFDVNPAQQIAEYIIQNQLLTAPALESLAREYDRRAAVRGGEVPDRQ